MTPRTTSAPSTRCRCGRASAASCSRRSPPPRNRMNSPHGLATTETRFFISSLGLGVKQFAKAVRNHWGIENTCHWSLDVTYREDDSRLRDAHARENFAWLNRFTLSLLKQHPGKGSLAVKRRSCGWQPRFRLEVLSWAKDFFAAGPGWVPPDTRDEVIDYIGTWTARAEVPVSGRAPPTRRATASSNVDTARSRTNASATRLLGTSRKRGVSWLTSSLTTTKSGSVAPSATSRRSTSSRDETPRS